MCLNVRVAGEMQGAEAVKVERNTCCQLHGAFVNTQNMLWRDGMSDGVVFTTKFWIDIGGISGSVKWRSDDIWNGHSDAVQKTWVRVGQSQKMLILHKIEQRGEGNYWNGFGMC